ncbi:MAG: T9SS type A sorting domain-containing protein [Bacteroidales bacterium]|nr:T9SS type A sorting domain-containing protein [Bacteroidales bacterium]MCB9012775.1 T9SS type A sorting domain-containing protein [Bacteroidales bacterium]
MKKLLLFAVCNLFWFQLLFAQWQPMNTGINGGFISTITLDSSSNYIYVGTHGHGVFISTDNGLSWKASNSGFSEGALNIASIAISEDKVYVGTYYDGIYSSDNKGNFWKSISHGLPNTYVSSIAVKGEYIFAGLDGSGIFLSTDNGNNWNPIYQGISPTNPIGVSVLKIIDSIIYAGTSEGMLNSFDNGKVWTKVGSNLYGSSITNYDSYVFFAEGGLGTCLSTESGSQSKWFFIDSLKKELPITSLAICSKNLFAGTRNGVFLSSDNGKNWTYVNNGLSENGLNVSSLAANENTIFIGTYAGGLYRSIDNGNSWISVSQDIIQTTVWTIALNENYMYLGTRGSGVFRSNNNGDKWEEANNGLESDPWNGLFVSAFATSNDQIFIGLQGGGVYLSSDFGESWTPANNGLSEDGLSVYALAINGNNMFAGTFNGLYLSTDNGKNWISSSNGMDLTGNYVSSISFIGNNIFAATNSNGIYLSIDNGSNWKLVSNGTTDNNGIINSSVSCLAVNDTKLYAGTLDQGIFLSVDNGNSWANISNNLSDKYVNAISFYKNTIYVGTSSGIYCSVDNGNMWFSIQSPFNKKLVNTMNISDGYLWVGFDDYSIWRIALSVINNMDVNKELANNDILFYPNPANDIIYLKDLSIEAIISIYDIKGNIIIKKRNIDNNVDINKLANGIYIINISDGNRIISKSFIKNTICYVKNK